MSKSFEKIKKIATREESSWLDEAKERQQNKGWRKRSFQIAARILIEIRKQKPINGMTQKMLAEKMCVAPQYINKVVKGQENLTLETIAKFEEVLGITLINVNKPEVNIDMESKDFISDDVASHYHEVYNSYQGFLHKIIFYKKEENFKFPPLDIPNQFLARYNRSELFERLSSFCATTSKNKSDFKESTFATYFNYILDNLSKEKTNEPTLYHSNDITNIFWKPIDLNEKSWKIFPVVKYSQKDKYENEG